MGNWSKLAMILAWTILLGSCSEQEINTEFSVTSDPVWVIPSKGTSCYAAKTTEAGQIPAPDIEASYFRIPYFSFYRQNSANSLIISMIKITYSIPGTDAGSEVAGQCILASDELRALSSTWWGSSPLGGEAIIPPGEGTPSTPFKTDCAALCGGISSTLPSFSTTATVEIFGLERDAQGSESPVRLQGFVNIQSL